MGLIHGNIKLTNIFLKDTERFTAVLGDCSSLKPIDYANSQPPENGGYTGTSLYVAPEVIAGAPKSPKSDVYAIGACVYVAIDSKGPFPGHHLGDFLELLEQSIATDPCKRILALQDS